MKSLRETTIIISGLMPARAIYTLPPQISISPANPYYILHVRAEDNGQMPRTRLAYVTVSFKSATAARSTVFHIDPENLGDPLGKWKP